MLLIIRTFPVLLLFQKVKGEWHKENLEAFTHLMEETTIKNYHCVEEDLELIGPIEQVFSPVLNFGDCQSKCTSKNTNFISFSEDAFLCTCLLMVNSSIYNELATSSAVECKNIEDFFIFKATIGLIYSRDFAKYRGDLTNGPFYEAQDILRRLKVYGFGLQRPCVRRTISSENAIFCGVQSPEETGFHNVKFKNYNCSFDTIEMIDFYYFSVRNPDKEVTTPNCYQACMDAKECHFWRLESTTNICTLWSITSNSKSNLITTPRQPLLTYITAYKGIKMGFKHCNIASGDATLWQMKVPRQEDPLFQGLGMPCNMSIPPHCRKLPTSSIVALPPAKVGGACLHQPKVSELVTSFCKGSITEYNFNSFCTYCVMDDDRNMVGLLTSQWTSCRLLCVPNSAKPVCIYSHTTISLLTFSYWKYGESKAPKGLADCACAILIKMAQHKKASVLFFISFLQHFLRMK